MQGNRQWAALVRMGVAAIGIVAAQPAFAQGWSPQRNVEFIVPAGAGGSMDTAMRTVEQVVRELKLVPSSTSLVNRAGGEHAVAYTFLQQRKADPHFLSLTSTVLLTNHLSGVLPLTYSDVTPIASLIAEYYLFVVGKDSPVKNAKEFIEIMKAKPDSLAIAVGNLAQRMSVGLPMLSANVDVKRVRIVTISGAKTSLSVAGGHVDVGVAAPGQSLPLVESGLLRAIAVSAPQRLGGALAALPTWAELGLKDADYTAWRGIIAPKDITPQQIAYWEGVMKRVTENDEFRKVAERNQWEITYRNAAEARRFMEREYGNFKRVMNYMGIIK